MGRDPQPLLAAGTVSDLRDVAGQESVELDGGQVGERRHAEPPQHGDLAYVERRLGDPQREVVVTQLGQAGLPPHAAVALAHADRHHDQRGIVRASSLPLGDSGDLDAEGVLVVVPLESAPLRPAARGRAGERADLLRVEAYPGHTEPVPQLGDLVGPDDAAVRDAAGGPSRRAEQPPVVGELEKVCFAAGEAEGPSRYGECAPLGRVAEGRDGEWLVGRARRLPLEHAVQLDHHREVAGSAVLGIVAAYPHVSAARPVAVAIEGQQAADDDRYAVGHCRQSRLRLYVVGLVTQRAAVDHPFGAVDEPSQHVGLERGPAREQLLQGLVQLRTVESRQERILRLDRAAARRVGVEDEIVHRGRRPRWRATMPPTRLRCSTAAQPQSIMSFARAFWSGQLMIDSTR